jgi:protein-disulfide isomerase
VTDPTEPTDPAGAHRDVPQAAEAEPAAAVPHPPVVAAPSDAGPRGVSPLAALAIALIAALVGYTVGATTAGDGAATEQPVAVQDAGSDPAGSGQVEPGSDTAGAVGGSGEGDRAGPGDELGEEVAANPLDVRPVLGSADAPVTIDIFSDFGCPFCHRHDEEVEPELIARYVETGQARLAWYDVPFQGPTSVRLHVGARVGPPPPLSLHPPPPPPQRQDLFWEFKEAVFRTSDGRDASPETLRALAGTAGLDVDRFETDLEDPALEQLVLGDLRAAQSAGVSGTPTFLVAGQPIVGAQPLSAFTEAMDQALQDGGA